ncbi:MAG: hypothetical protein HXS54_03025 [Theionarchaea archaeon]|nr:hypothetical protein [Theionarchaea archaeon]
MTDILLICIREEYKEDFIREFIMELISRGLTISYAGAYYNERGDKYVYDDDLDIPFSESISFEKAPMRSKNFVTWEGFLDNITFEQIDVKLVIYFNARRLDPATLKEKLRHYLNDMVKDIIVEMIRDSFELSFSDFESRYRDIVDILGIDKRLLEKLRNHIEGSSLRGVDWWPSPALDIFISRCSRLKSKIEEGSLTEEYSLNLDEAQKELERECLKDPIKCGELIEEFLFSEIEKTLDIPEGVMFLDISRRTQEHKILCLYNDVDTNKGKSRLFFYPGKLAERHEELTEEEIETEAITSVIEEEKVIKVPFPPFEMTSIPRNCLFFSWPGALLSPEAIESIVDHHIMPALQPPPIDIHFPVNDFMLEVDPEEPEIGFLSRRVYLNNFQTIEENLKIDTNLRKKVSIYRVAKDEYSRYEKFTKSNIRSTSDRQKEDIFVIGRIEDLFKIFAANRRYGFIYKSLYDVLKFLALLAVIFLILKILETFILGFSEAIIVTFLIAIIFGVTILFFMSFKRIILNYILDPMYEIIKGSFYILLVLILYPRESTSYLSIFLLFLASLTIIALFNSHICSAILHDFNNSFKIIGRGDTLSIEGLNAESTGTLEVLKCGRFQTILKKDNNICVFSNLNLFSKIKWINKKTRTVERKMAYSSAIFLSPGDMKRSKPSERDIGELVCRITLENTLFGKREIMLRGSEEVFSQIDRHIYFGPWNQVMSHIENAALLFTRSMLSKMVRRMVILAIFLGLVFNIFRAYVYNRSFMEFTGSLGNIHFTEVVVLIAVLWIYLARILKIRMWKASLALVFYLLIWFQPSSIGVLVFPFLLVAIFFLQLPIKQAFYYFNIWWYEMKKGRIISIVNKDNLRGTVVDRNLLATELKMYDSDGFEEKRIYFNEQFYNDVLTSSEWEIIW